MDDPQTTRQLGPASGGSATAATPRDAREHDPGDAPPRESDLVLGRYRMVRRIGRGGHGSVWEAFDERLEREVAVKVVSRADGRVGPRAEREGRVAARLNHPGIVALYELGSDASSVLLVSELVRGRTMAELARAGALSDSDVARVGLALCSALAHAHARGVIHRDVKPQNVIVVAEPAAGEGFAKLTDFGIAHLRGDDTLTRTGDIVGTFAYMAPEQAEGDRVTAAADVYSLALALHEAWSGAGPEGVVAARLAGRPVTSLGRLRGRELPPALCDVVDAALDLRPERRPPLGALEDELRAALDTLSEEGGLVEPETRRRFGILAARPSRELAVPSMPSWAPRLLAAGGSATLAAAAVEQFGSAGLPPVAAAMAAGGLTALLPRIGWMLSATAVVIYLLLPVTDARGAALIVAAALVPVPVLLPRAGHLWSAPALAPLLGLAALAPLFIALAGLATTAWRRLGLALAGFAWLSAFELLSGRTLAFGPAEEVASPRTFDDSLMATVRDAAYPQIDSLALVPGALWAALALLLGLAVRGRTLALDLLGATAFGVALVAGHIWIGELLADTTPRAEPRGLVAAAVIGAAAAVGLAALRRRRAQERWVDG